MGLVTGTAVLAPCVWVGSLFAHFGIMDTNACTRYFCELLRNIVDMHAPIKTKTIRHNNFPYMNSELRKWQYKRNMLRNVKKQKSKETKL